MNSYSPDRQPCTSFDLPSPPPNSLPQREEKNLNFSPVYPQQVKSSIEKSFFSIYDDCNLQRTSIFQSVKQNSIKEMFKGNSMNDSSGLAVRMQLGRQFPNSGNAKSLIRETASKNSKCEKVKTSECCTLKSVGLVRAVSEKLPYISPKQVSKKYPSSPCKINDNRHYVPEKCVARPWPRNPFTIELEDI